MAIQLLTDILKIQGYFVTEYKIVGKIFFITIDAIDYPVCPKCKQTHLFHIKDKRAQEIEDLSISGKRVKLLMSKRRIECGCGYRGTEKIEWLEPYERSTIRFGKMIYVFCKRMTCLDVSRVFGISKEKVYRIDKENIQKELDNQPEIKPEMISIDEISRKKGHIYATIVSSPKEKKIIDVLFGRKTVDLAEFYRKKCENWCKNIKIVTMDAWPAFRKATKKYCSKAKICFDHFHLAQHFSKAIDKLRLSEARKAGKKHNEIYTGTKWLMLKNPENLKEKEKLSLNNLLEVNKKLFIAYILRSEFREIFSGETAHSRLVRFSLWIKKASLAGLPFITKFVKQIERWSPFIKNSLLENVSNSYGEGINVKIRVIQRMAYGYKDKEYLRLKIFQQFNFRNVHSIYDT